MCDIPTMPDIEWQHAIEAGELGDLPSVGEPRADDIFREATLSLRRKIRQAFNVNRAIRLYVHLLCVSCLRKRLNNNRNRS
jgi:hypothetical protein